MYSLEILHKSGKRVETKSHKVFRANSDVYRSCRGKIGRGFSLPSLPILNRVKVSPKLEI